MVSTTRRAFLLGAGGALLAPRLALAQPPKVARVGLLTSTFELVLNLPTAVPPSVRLRADHVIE
jgi:hypothetical protein